MQKSTTDKSPHQPLPPLSKGGGLTARHKPLYCCFLLVPHPPFLFTKPFYRQDGGIASPLRFAPHSYRPLSKVRCCRRKNSSDYRRDCHTYRTLSVSLTPPLTIPHSTPNHRKTALSFENHQHPCLPCQREARHKPLYCCFLLVPRPPFLFTKPFCRQDGGIASLPFASHHILTAPCQR